MGVPLAYLKVLVLMPLGETACASPVRLGRRSCRWFALLFIRNGRWAERIARDCVCTPGERPLTGVGRFWRAPFSKGGGVVRDSVVAWGGHRSQHVCNGLAQCLAALPKAVRTATCAADFGLLGVTRSRMMVTSLVLLNQGSPSFPLNAVP